MVLSYDGTRYFGWEHQPGTDMTIQGKLETVLGRMVGAPEDRPLTVIGAGRTDAGVHARAMTANVILDTEMTEAEILAYMNEYLPEDISINEVRIASDRFHSRFNAKGKTYRYTCYYGSGKPVFDRRYVTILEQKPSLDRMKAAAEVLVGTHDFRAFCGNASHMKKSTVRYVSEIRIWEKGPYIYLEFSGNGFLRNMVRIMTGTLLEAGYGNFSTEDVQAILESLDRRKAGPTAPAKGLCMMQVDY